MIQKDFKSLEKDKGRKLNIHSAGKINSGFISLWYNVGILAAIWPCGIVVHVAELFRSESIGQVYGQLHQFMQDNRFLASDLSMLHSVHLLIIKLLIQSISSMMMAVILRNMLFIEAL